jgi:histone H3/H4
LLSKPFLSTFRTHVALCVHSFKTSKQKKEIMTKANVVKCKSQKNKLDGKSSTTATTTHVVAAGTTGNEAIRRCIKRAGISRISKNATEYAKSVLEKVTARVLHNAIEETIYSRKTTVSEKAILRSLERLGEGLHR